MIPKQILLTGMPGCRKSVIGRMMADKLGYIFINLDEILDDMQGRSLQDVFDQAGEKGFRRMENWFMDRYLEMSKVVLAAGGGTIINAKLMERLLNNTYSIYLQASSSRLFKRLSTISADSLIAGQNGKLRWEHIQSMLLSRQGIYEQADMIQNVDSDKGETLAVEILKQLLFDQPGEE